MSLTEILSGVEALGKTYATTRETVTGKPLLSVQTSGSNAPLVEQGKPAAVAAVAPNTTTTVPVSILSSYGPILLAVAAAVAAVLILRK